MQSLTSFLTETEILVYIGIAGYVLGFIFKNQIILRVLVFIATFSYIAYYYVYPADPLWGAIWGSVLILIANVIGMVRLLYSRLPIGIPAEQWPVFKALQGLSPGEFRQLMKLGVMRFAEERVQLTTQNRSVPCLYFAISGELEGDKSGHAFKMYGGEFIGEVSFMLGGDATASVTMQKGGVYYEWPKEALKLALEAQPRLEQAFEALIGRDMAKKVADGHRLSRPRKHSADVEFANPQIAGPLSAAPA